MSDQIIILGLGNELLGDDGAGLVLARMIHSLLPEGTADLVLADLSGMSLMHALEKYDRAIIIDSIQSHDYQPGECLRSAPGGQLESRRLRGIHDTPLAMALEMGRELKLHLPHYIAVYLMNGLDTHTFSDKLSPAVERALPDATQQIVMEEFGKK